MRYGLKQVLFGSVCSSVVAMSLGPIAIAQEEGEDEAAVLDTVEVVGIRSSLEQSIDQKRAATEIIDTITAEDIGELADDNVAEALQRVTGIQMERSADGEGSTVQIRGFSNNNVQINGQTVSGSSADRSLNFQDVPSELFAGIDVEKAASADDFEGSLGGTVNLRTRRPLAGERDFVASLTATGKYYDISEETDTDFNAFLLKQFNDTGFGDIGVILNFGRVGTTTTSEVYGGGDFDDAPGIWVRRTGADTARNPFLAAGPYQYDANVDVNGDGVSDANDIFYIPNGFGFFENTRTSERDSFNGTLQWQPNDRLEFNFDTTLTDITENLTGSRYSLNFNTVRSAPLASGNNTYDLLAQTGELGDVYVMTGGRIGAVTTRMGASPSQNEIDRESEQYTLSADWQATDKLNLRAEYSMSEGSANTVVQGALVTGIDFDGNGALNAGDFAGIVDFDLSGSAIPDVTFFESPFPAPNFGVTSLQTTLTEIAPNDINYERLAYFQFNRVAQDTENTADAFRLDATYEIDNSWITSVSAGLRLAERTFGRQSYQNGNQRGNAFPSTLAAPGSDQVERINVQRIRTNPASNADPDIRAASEFLAQCFAPGGDAGLLSEEGGNLPRTWTSTAGCNVNDLSAAFNLLDIRAVDPLTGVGFYERTGLRYDVSEETDAFYVRADYDIPLGDMRLFGNVGGRYIETDTNSSGFIQDAGGNFVLVSLDGSYTDFLPSLNANLALNEEMLVRLGISKSLGRPGLARISPGLNLNRNEAIDGFDGNGTGGNPDLDPVRSTNFDLSYEWYYDKGNLLSIAYFYKDIDSTIFLGDDQIPVAIGDEDFLIRTFGNFEGTKVQGIELGLTHNFVNLPGLLSNTGIAANYTIVDEDSDLVDQEGDEISRRGLSSDTYNLTAFYDDGKLSLRAAYNWRDEFVRRENVNLGFGSPNFLPEVVDARGQLDLAAAYNITDNLRVKLDAININDSKTERFLKYNQLTNYIAFAGPRYNLSVTYRF